jgi:hypothetical protein
MKLNKTPSNTKSLLMLRMRRFKTHTKQKMKQEKHTTKPCMILTFKTTKSDGLEVRETKRRQSNLNLPTDKLESKKREKKFLTVPIQTRSKLKHVIISSSIATSLSNNMTWFLSHQRMLPKNLINNCKTII